MSFLNTLTTTLGVPDARQQLLQAPSYCSAHWLDTVQQWADWTREITKLLPDAVQIRFSTSSDYDDEGGYYTNINWYDTQILDAEGNELIGESSDLDELIESLQNLESDLDYPRNWPGVIDFRKLPTLRFKREDVVDNLEQWIALLKQLPDDAFYQATP